MVAAPLLEKLAAHARYGADVLADGAGWGGIEAEARREAPKAPWSNCVRKAPPISAGSPGAHEVLRTQVHKHREPRVVVEEVL